MKNRYRNILLFLTFLIGFPSLFVIWAFVDDGHSIWVSQKMTIALLSGDVPLFIRQIIEPELGRLRPVYWLFQWLFYLIGDKNHYLRHFWHLIMFLTVIFLLFEIVKKITDSSKAAFFAGLFFVINRLNIENWYRLGTAEPYLVLVQLSSLYFLFLSSRKIFFYLSCLLVALSFFAKETQVAFIPLTFLLWLLLSFLEKKPNKKIEFKNRYLVFFLVNLFFGSLARLITMKLGVPEGSNASYYQVNLQSAVYNTLLYFRTAMGTFEPLLSIAILSFITRTIFAIKEKKIFKAATLWQFFFLCWFLFFILIQSPWSYVLNRYFLPSMIGLAIFLGLEYSQMLEFFQNTIAQKGIAADVKSFMRFAKWLILFFIVVVFSYNGIVIVNYIKEAPNNFDEKMLDFLNQNSPTGGKIYFNFVGGDANLELYYEIPLHLKLFYGREDLRFGYLDLSEKNKLEKDDLIVSGNGVPVYTEERIATYSGIARVAHFRRGVANLVTTKPVYLIKKIVFLQNPLPGLYTLTHNYYNWYVYQYNTKEEK